MKIIKDKYYYYNYDTFLLHFITKMLLFLYYRIKGVKVTLLNIKKKSKSKRSVFKFQRNRLKMKRSQP